MNNNRTLEDLVIPDISISKPGCEINVSELNDGIVVDIGALQTRISSPCTGLPRVVVLKEDTSLIITPTSNSYDIQTIQTPKFYDGFKQAFEASVQEVLDEFVNFRDNNPIFISNGKRTKKLDKDTAIIIKKSRKNKELSDGIEVIKGASYLVLRRNGYTIKIRTSRRDSSCSFHSEISEGLMFTNFLNFWEMQKLLIYTLQQRNYQ